MTQDFIFVHRYRQIEEIMRGDNPARVIDIALILRQFFLDGTPLVIAVNRSRKLPIRFRALESTDDHLAGMIKAGLPEPSAFALFEIGGNRPIVSLKMQKFLSHNIFYSNGTHMSVHDVIDACAHKFGGVHFEEADKDTPKIAMLREFNDAIEVDGVPFAFRLLCSIGRIATHGLQELYKSCGQS